MSKLRNQRLALLSLMILLALIVVGQAAAQSGGPVTDDEVNEIAKEVYCPVCESTPLDVCETKACADWRELIRTKLGEGQTKAEIFQYFANQYGDRVLASPPREGFNLILWVGPIVAVIIGAALFSWYLRRLRLAAAGNESAAVVTAVPQPAPDAADKDYISRIEKELAER